MIKEACVGNLESASLAEKLGANQLELCDRLDLDGTSPELETIKAVCAAVTIPVKVIINPNPFHYVYNQKDTDLILAYLDKLNRLPIGGIVFGPLNKDGYPDLKLIRLVANNTNLPITYHKAIDQSRDILQSVSLLKQENTIDYILSSGGKETAMEGKTTLLEMKTMLKDSSINLIAAGRITFSNLEELHAILQLNDYHGKRIVGDLTRD